jgi:hypothetical protein
VFARGERPLQPRNRRGLRTHTFSHLGLRETGFMSRAQQEVQEGTFFALDAFNLFPHSGTAHEASNDFIVALHS